MVERAGPYSVLGDLNTLDQRLRTVERHQHGAIETITQIAATVADGGAGFDAIVTGTEDLTVSPPTFETPGEALSYCDATLGLDRALVLVRDGSYTETADWTAPNTYLLFSASSGGLAGTGAASWSPGAFQCTSGGDTVFVQGIEITIGSSAVSAFMGGTNDPQEVTFFNCNLIHSTAPAAFNYGVNVYLLDTTVQQMRPTASDGLYWYGGEMTGTTHAGSPVNVTFNNDVVMRDVLLTGGSGGGVATWTINATFDVDVQIGGGRVDALTTSLLWTLGVSASIDAKVAVADGDASPISVTTPASGKAARLEGSFNNLSIGSLVATQPPHRIDVWVDGTCDIATAIVDLRRQSASSAGFTFRGAVHGHIHTRGPNPSSGTYLDFISAFNCVLTVSASEGSATGTAQPWAFDGASADNLLIFPDHDQWPVAGTNAGTNNIVVPPFAGGSSGAAPSTVDYLVGTASADLSSEIVAGATPGGELGGTWAAPTVDATHSGSAHGVAVEDEGAAQGQALTTNFVGAGVTAAVVGSVATITVPGGGSSDLTASDWMGL